MSKITRSQFSCRVTDSYRVYFLKVFSLGSLWAHVLSKSIALHFACCCHLRQGQATKKVILDYTYMTLKYPDAITFFLSCWLRKEGIAIESARKIVEGLADDDDKLHDRLATLEDTYSKAQMKSKGTELLQILEAQLGSTDKSTSNPKRSTRCIS